MEKITKKKKLSLVIFLGINIFLIIFFQFIINIYINPYDLVVPHLIFAGYAIIIVIFLFLFINLNTLKKERVAKIKLMILSEFWIKFFLILSMGITFFIYPETSTTTIMSWSEINFLNYIRAIAMILCCSYLPGSCFYNIFFKNQQFLNNFKINPLIFKITLYPLFSFMIFGMYSMFLEFIGVSNELFALYIYFLIISLFIIDTFIQVYRNEDKLRLKKKPIYISKKTLMIIFISIGTIFIAAGIFIASRYLIHGDIWRGNSYAFMLGNMQTTPITKLCGSDSGAYYAYWGYISYGFSVMAGIPFINTNALLFIFSYLYVTSFYLMILVILKDYSKVYSIMGTIFFILFSQLFLFFDIELKNTGTLFIINGFFQFSYRSYSFLTAFISLILFIIAFKHSLKYNDKSNFKQNIILIVLSALFLLQSYMTYFFPLIIGLTFFLAYFIFLKEKKQFFKFFIYFSISFVLLFIIIDIFSAFYFSWIPARLGALYIDVARPIVEDHLISNAIFVYLFLTGFLLCLFLINSILKKKEMKKRDKYRGNSYSYNKTFVKSFYLILLVIFLALVIFNIINVYYGTTTNNFFNFYLNLIVINIGIPGILTVCFLYFTYKKDKRLLKTLVLWSILIIGFASLLIFWKWITYPFLSPLEIPYDEYIALIYFFYRTWYFSIIPISILASVGLIEFQIYLKKKYEEKMKNKSISYHKKLLKLNSACILIFLIITNTIIPSIYWYNWDVYLKDEEVQVMGWVTENIPADSNILIDRYLMYHLMDLEFCNIHETYYIGDLNNNEWNGKYEYDDNCNISLIKSLDMHEQVLDLYDDESFGNVRIDILFNTNDEIGVVEFYWQVSNNIIPNYLILKQDTKQNAIFISIRDGEFKYYNGSHWIGISICNTERWYHNKIEFFCDQGDTGKFNWFINGTKVLSNIDFNIKSDKINYLYIETSHYHAGGNSFKLDSINFTGNKMFCYLEEALFYVSPSILNLFRHENLSYFIVSRNNQYKFRYLLEDYFNMYVYNYQTLAIAYCKEFEN